MVFSSLFFLFLFLPISLALYYIVPRALKNIVLIACSLVFYAWGTPEYIVLMIFSVIFNYCAGLEMDLLRRQERPKRVRLVLILSVVVNLLLLGFFKYWGFLVENINRLGLFHLNYTALPLPIGISFYTFQVLSYLFDVYREKVAVQRNFIYYATYVTFFPKLVSGPIVPYHAMEAQLQSRPMNATLFGEGAALFLTGLFKKVLIADNLNAAFTSITALPLDNMSTVTAWLGSICYTLLLYFDFSSYSDMAIGLGKMFGFDIAKNFDYPYLSKSITEFWRRWHISLGSWFRDYVYFPLGGSRVSTGKILRNLLIIWLLTGIWHGAAWTFIFWGLLHGAAQILEKFPLKKALEKVPGWLKWLGTMLVVHIGWVFFFSPSLGSAFGWLGQMLGAGSGGFLDSTAKYYLGSNWLLLVIAIIGCGPVVKNFALNFASSKGTVRKVICVAVFAALLILCMGYLVNATYRSFLYFNF